jgi:hypothetical protein
MLKMNLITQKELWVELWVELYDEVGEELFWKVYGEVYWELRRELWELGSQIRTNFLHSKISRV